MPCGKQPGMQALYNMFDYDWLCLTEGYTYVGLICQYKVVNNIGIIVLTGINTM